MDDKLDYMDQYEVKDERVLEVGWRVQYLVEDNMTHLCAISGQVSKYQGKKGTILAISGTGIHGKQRAIHVKFDGFNMVEDYKFLSWKFVILPISLEEAVYKRLTNVNLI